MPALTIPWIAAELSIDAGTLDSEHREVLTQLNALLIAIDGGDRTRTTMALSALASASSAHFADEERKMAESAYPDASRHRAQHQRLLQGLAELRSVVDAAGALAAGTGPYVFLSRWFVPHLRNDDRRLAEYLAARDTAAAVPRRADPAIPP